MRIVRTPLTLLVLLAVLGYGAWWGYKNVIATVPPPAPVKCVPQKVSAGELRSAQVTVSIYNGGSKKGLAADVARSMRSRGFQVKSTDNTGQKIGKTIIVGSTATNPEVLLVRGFFKNSQVRADKRVDGSVDVLVGDAYGGFDKKAKTSYRVKSKTVCLPAQPKPTTAVN